MSKAILVMDMPESCDKCTLFHSHYSDMCCGGLRNRTINYPYPKDFRQEWCPLKELINKYPEKYYVLEDESNVSNKLPTKEEYENKIGELNLEVSMNGYSLPKYLCPECGGGMRKNLMFILTSNPPKYEYRCDSCNHIDFQYY